MFARVERKAGLAVAERPSTSLPYGFMAGYSKRVLNMLMACEMADKARRLMGLLIEEGFGNAGRETEHPDEAGLWVNVDTAKWIGTLHCQRQYVSQLIAHLIELGMVSQHQPPPYDKNDPRTHVSSRLRINPNFAEWKPLDPAYCAAYHERRFVRPNAGYPKGRKRTGEHKVLDIREVKQASVKNWISDSQTTLEKEGAEQAQSGTSSPSNAADLAICSKSKTLTTLAVDAPEMASNTLASLAHNGPKQTQNFNHACSKSGNGASKTGGLLKITKEEKDEKKKSPNGDALATPDASAGLATEKPEPAASSQTEPAQQVLPFGTDVGAAPAPPVTPQGKRTAKGKTGVTREQLAALWVAWDACERTIKFADIGKGEYGRHYKDMTRLIQDGITPESLSAYVTAKHQEWAWKREPYVLKPCDLANDLATLRPIVRGEVVATTLSNGHSQKGANHAGLPKRHTGEYTGNHGRDADLIQRC